MSKASIAVVALARTLAGKRPKGGTRTLRDIAAELASAGHFNGKGRQYAPAAIAKMLGA